MIVFGSILQTVQPQVTHVIVLTFLLLPVAAELQASFSSYGEEGIEWVAAAFFKSFSF